MTVNAEELFDYVADQPVVDVKPTRTDYVNSTYMIVSKVAYLIGVEKRHFENEHEPPKIKWYNELQINKHARIIRNLCMLRTAIEQNYNRIYNQIVNELKNLHSLPEYIPQDSLQELLSDGITVEKSNCKPLTYIIDINKEILNRINNCKSIFPLWVNWDYIKKLFIMPNGTNEKGVKAAGEEYYQHKNSYPYQTYINWTLLDRGNILFDDKKFVTLLYEENRDIFYDIGKVTDAGNITKNSVYDFLDNSERCTIVVDCENSDPYKLHATLHNLDQEALLSKIVKIILYDDIHTTSAWGILKEFTDIPIEHITIDRIKEQKSLVDIRLSTGTVVEYYENNIDSFILCSSDSDYWGMISALPKIKFLVLVESGKVGPAIKNALLNEGITYCYIDNFCTGNTSELKVRTLVSEVQQKLDQAFHININDLLEEAYEATRANISPAEKQQFYNRYIKPMRVVIDRDGEATIELGQ